MEIRAQLRAHAPRLYRGLLLTHQRLRDMREGPDRRRALQLLQDGTPLNVTISRQAGLGGLLWHAAWSLEIGRRFRTEVALRFTSPTYMPEPPVDDWLDAYFTRRGSEPSPQHSSVDSAHLPPVDLDIVSAGTLLWSALAVRDEIRESVQPYITSQYVAVHYRGSDKSLEREPADPEWLLEEVRRQSSTLGVERVFIASDEEWFYKRAFERFGERGFRLPQIAKATSTRAAHFSSTPGQVKAHEALQTMLVLGGARAIVRSNSFLSEWAGTFARSGTPIVVAEQRPA